MGLSGAFFPVFSKTLAFPPQKLYTKSKELHHTFGFLAVFADATHPRKGTVNKKAYSLLSGSSRLFSCSNQKPHDKKADPFRGQPFCV